MYIYEIHDKYHVYVGAIDTVMETTIGPLSMWCNRYIREIDDRRLLCFFLVEVENLLKIPQFNMSKGIVTFS